MKTQDDSKSPDWKKVVRLRLASLQIDPARQTEIVEELSVHLEDRYVELLALGETEEEAYRVTHGELIDEELLALELTRVERTVAPEPLVLGGDTKQRMVHAICQDVTYGIRVMWKTPGFTALTVLILALGIGANTAIFSLTDKLLIKSLPVRSPQQLFLINSISVNPYFVSISFSYPDFTDYRAQNKVFDGLLAFSRSQLELQGSDSIERVASEYVSGNYFAVLGVTAAQGRTFSPDEDRTPSTEAVVVISDSFARKRFGNSSAIGQTLNLNGIPLVVIGITPPDFNGMMLERPTDVWVPLLMHPQLAQSKFIENRKDRWLLLMGRMKEGVSQAKAEAELDLLAEQIKTANTPPNVITKGLPFSEQHIKFEPGGKGISVLRKRFSSPLKLLMAIVGMVLLIACANVAGLLLARGIARRKEIAIRLSLGANGWRVTRQLFIESLLLAVTAGAIGLLLAPWLMSLLTSTQPRLESIRDLWGSGVDLNVLAFTALTTLIAVLVFGLVPAWQSANVDVVKALKETDGDSNRRLRFKFRSILVITQVALAIVVLIGAGLCVRSLQNLLTIDPGYQTERLLIVPLELDEKKYDESRGRVLQQQIVERLSGVPGVAALSCGSVMPLSGSRYMSSIFVEGRQTLPNEQMMAFDASTVGPRYHETMDIKIVQGRGFTDQDRDGAPGVIIINETMAQKLFPGQNPLGQKLSLRTGTAALEIIGVAGDIKHHDLTETPIPHFDLPALQRDYSSSTNLVLRVRGSAEDIIPTVRKELLALDPSLEIAGIKPMSAQVGNALAAMRLASLLVAVFGMVALLLASIGLYGVMAWLVGRRAREVGIRMALGAQVGDVIALILRQGMALTAVGIVIGLAVAFLSTRVIESQLYGVSPTDPFTFISIALLLGIVAFLACYIPARRATKIDPIKVLRYE